MLNFVAALLGGLAAIVFVVVRMLWLLPAFALSMASNSKEPDNPEWHFDRGVQLVETDPKRAISELTLAMQGLPPHPATYNYRGMAYFSLRDFHKAIADYSVAISLEPSVGLSYLNRGMALAQRGNISEGIADFETAVALDPDLPYEVTRPFSSVYQKRGITLVQMDRPNDAISNFGRAIELDPLDVDPYHFRGEARLLVGSYVRAVADFNTAIGLSDSGLGLTRTIPARNAAWSAIGEDPLAALPFLKRGLRYVGVEKAEPDDSDLPLVEFPEIDYYPGLVADRLEVRSRMAIADFSTVLYFDPGNAEAYRARGDCYRANGQHGLAQRDYAVADELSRDP